MLVLEPNQNRLWRRRDCCILEQSALDALDGHGYNLSRRRRIDRDEYWRKGRSSMHKILEEPIPVPAEEVAGGDCICICKKPTTSLNEEIAAIDIADISTDVAVDIEDPPG
jgi:hypothetical protein